MNSWEPQDPSPSTPSQPALKATFTPVPRIVYLLFAIVGLACMALGGYFGWSTLSRISGAQRVDGRVVEILREQVQDASDRHDAFLPVVEYEFAGRSHRIRGGVSDRNLSVGQKLPLLVRPDRPADGMIDSFQEKWLSMLMVGGIGFLFVLFAAVAYVWAPRTSSVAVQST